VVGQIGGSSFAVATQGHHAYVGIGPRLAVLNVADPSHPVPVGESPIFPDYVRGVAIVEEYAYVAAGAGGLFVVNVSNPAQPTITGLYDTSGDAQSVTVAGDYAYVADEDAGLRVIDIGTPSTPTEIASYNPTSSIRDVVVAGNYAYLATYGDGLHLLDISNPHAPAHQRTYGTSHAKAVTISGNHAYLVHENGLSIFNVTNPLAAEEITSVPSSSLASGIGNPRDVVVVGNYAYLGFVSEYHGNLAILDVTNPAEPVRKVVHRTPGTLYALTVTDNHAYLAQGFQENLLVLDVSTPGAPAEVGSYETPSYVRDVSVAGNYAYLVDSHEGLRILDVTNPRFLTQVGAVTLPIHQSSSLWGLDVEDNVAYLTDFTYGLRIVDVSNPAAPIEVGAFGPSNMHEVDVVGEHAYTAGSPYGIINVSDPTSPTLTYGYGFGGYDIEVRQNLAHVARPDGVAIFDVSTPSAPREVGTFDTLGLPRGLTAAGDYLYVADQSPYDSTTQAGLRILNVSTPSAPVQVGSYPTAQDVNEVAVVNGYAYLTESSVSTSNTSRNTTGGVRAIDVRNPTAPAEVGFYNTAGQAYQVTTAGEFAYVADGHGGLVIVRLTDSPITATPTRTVTVATTPTRTPTPTGTAMSTPGSTATVVGTSTVNATTAATSSPTPTGTATQTPLTPSQRELYLPLIVRR
jgi:hypothetical protein